MTDLAGAPAELIDPETGQVAGRSVSTVWGQTRWDGASTPLSFMGQQVDAETGLHYNRFRFYDPVTSTYTSADPLGVAPNPASATAYVHNPHTWIDPLGLHPAGNAKGDGDQTRRWSVGDDPMTPTSRGEPAWSTQRSRYWKNEADANPAGYTDTQLDRMRRGGAPQRFNQEKFDATGNGRESMELSHEPIPRRDGGVDVVPRWPQDHARIDPHRRLNY